MSRQKYSWVPGLYKCFDEGIVNCRDHYIRLNNKLKEKEKNILPVKNIDPPIPRVEGREGVAIGVIS